MGVDTARTKNRRVDAAGDRLTGARRYRARVALYIARYLAPGHVIDPALLNYGRRFARRA
jgi:hypothetical protein